MKIINGHTLDEVINTTKSFGQYLYKRLFKEQIHVVAGYLAYVTLMSLVPLVVVMLSVMTAFPIFADIRLIIENFVYSNFVPAAGDVVQTHLTGFVSNASRMSAVAISFLFLFALLLISAIDSTLNRIWGVTTPRRKIISFSMYWMVLTLGPVLIGSSIAATSYFASLVSLGEVDIAGFSKFLFSLLPLMASVAAFVILYVVVPNCVVRVKHALAGAFVAAILFELAKKGFAIYIHKFPSYEAIYGALAGIPILFLWVYLSWVVVLIGAIVTVSIEEFIASLNNKIENNTEKLADSL